MGPEGPPPLGGPPSIGRRRDHLRLKRQIKSLGLGCAQMAGLFSVTQKSQWRRQRLLVLGYHGLSVEREHEWMPTLFIPPELFHSRMSVLKSSGIRVVSLCDG